MIPLTSITSLPKLGQANVSDQLINYGVADSSTLMNETYTSMSNTFGGTGPFGKVASTAPTFYELGAASLGSSGGATSTDSPYSLISAAEGGKIKFGTSSFTAAQVRDAVGDTATDDNSHFVRLKASVFDGATNSIIDLNGLDIEPNSEMEVVFYIMPQISETYDANYEPLAPAQMPGEFQKYKGSSSTRYNISNAKFTARTREEARRNYLYLSTLRGWTKPYFGKNQGTQFDNKLGAPPPVLQLSGWRNLMGPISVVLTRLQWTWPDEVDWLPTGIYDKESNKEIPFPAVITVSLDLVESLSAEQFNNFNLVAFRRGFIGAAWDTQPAATTSTRGGEPTSGQQSVKNGVVEPNGSSDTGTSQRAQTSVLYGASKVAEQVRGVARDGPSSLQLDVSKFRLGGTNSGGGSD
jgi:hypothetical protein